LNKEEGRKKQINKNNIKNKKAAFLKIAAFLFFMSHLQKS